MQVAVKWKNNDMPEFEKERLQKIERELDYLYFHTQGIYQTRQYEVVFTDPSAFALINLEEEVEVIGR